MRVECCVLVCTSWQGFLLGCRPPLTTSTPPPQPSSLLSVQQCAESLTPPQHRMSRYYIQGLGDKAVWLLTRLSLVVMCDVTSLTRHSCQLLAWASCCGTCLVASFGCRPCPVIRVWCLWLLQAQQQKTAQIRLEILRQRALDEFRVRHVSSC